MKRIITTFIIVVVSYCIILAHAAGPDDFVIVQTSLSATHTKIIYGKVGQTTTRLLSLIPEIGKS